MSKRGGGRNPPQRGRGPPPSTSKRPSSSSSSSSGVTRSSPAPAPTPTPTPTTPAPTRAPAPAPAPAPARAPAPAPAPAPASARSRATLPSPSTLAPQLEQRLTLKEEEAKPSQQAPPPKSSTALRFPARPGYGTLGHRCIVKANHFLVELSGINELYHYDVAISPEVTSREVNRAVIGQLIDLYKVSHLGTKLPVYDGKKSLYTAGNLPFTSKDFTIKLPDRDGRTGAASRERQFNVTIRFVGQASLYHLQQFLQGRQVDTPQDTIQVLDVVLRESPSKNYSPVGRSFFSPRFGERSTLGGGVECWRGFYQSIRPTQMGLSLNIDISATSFFEPISVIDFIAELLRRDQSRFFSPFSDIDRAKVRKALKGVRVEVSHTPARRRYRISGLTTQHTNQLTFPNDETGTQMSVVQYFMDKYRVPLEFGTWPAFQVGSDSKPTYMPMEVCKIVEGQRYSKKLNERQVTAILRATCQRPNIRERNISDMVKTNAYNSDKYAKEFGIRINERLASVEARVLDPPKLNYHDTGREKHCIPSVGQWNMINKKMVNGATVTHWTCLNLSRLGQSDALRFCNELVQMCSNIGMRFNPTPVIPIRAARTDRLDMVLGELYKQAAGRIELLIIILPDMSGLYGRIKRVCETELGMVSQCCQPRQASKPNNKQYLENVALKVNVKAGGRNTVLADAISRKIPHVTDKEPTIIFGADVTHPPPGEDSSPSIAAVVASQDWPEITKYCGLVSAQKHRQEIIQNLFQVVEDPNKGRVNGGMIRELLMSFRRSTGMKPHRIIFYRDGVSEGQFNDVLLYELDAIHKACASLEEGYLPPVTFVVVQKRHHTRLFATDRQATDRSGNILPGTVVDTKICHPFEFDFYLCSHAGIQGTSRPTHYHVLWDDNGFTADQLQTLTNDLCYTYARCTRSVSVVPPAYYAHLAAFRARYYMEDGASDGGSSVGGTRGHAPAVVRPIPQAKENVKRVMYFC